MADKSIIVEINYDTAEGIKSINALTSAIEGERVAQQRLKAELESGKISQNQYSIEVEKSKAEMNKANAERKAAIALLGAEKGSVDQIKAAIKDLTLKRDKLNQTTAEGREAAKRYTAQIDSMRESLRGATNNSKGLLGTLEGMPGPIGGVVSGIMGMVKASLAFIATPLGAILAAIAATVAILISVFKTFDPLLDKIEQGVAAVSAAFTWLKEAVIGVVTGQKAHNETMKEAIKNAIALKEAEQDLADQQKINAVEQKKSKRLIDELLLQSKDRTKSEKERSALIDEALKVEENAFNKRKAMSDEEVRIAQEHIINGRSLTQEQIKNLREGGVAYAIQLSQIKGIKDEEIDALRDALIKSEEIQNESTNLREKAINRQNALEDAAKAEAEKRQEAINKAREKANEEEKKRVENLAEFKRKTVEDEYKLNLDIANNEEDIRISVLEALREDSEEEKKIIEETAEKRGQAIVELAKLKEQELIDNAKKLEEKANAEIDAADAERQRKLDQANLTNEELELIEYEHKVRLEEIDNEFQEKLKEKRALEMETAMADLQAIVDASQGVADARVTIGSEAFAKLSTINWNEVKDWKDGFSAIGNAAKGLTAMIGANYDKQFKDLEAQKAYELSLAGDNKDAQEEVERQFANKKAAIQKKQAQDEKKKAIIDAAIATALAVVNSLKAGLPIGLVFAAIAGALGGVQIAAIANQPAPTFQTYAKGGMIGGKSHSQGGTKFFGEDGSSFEAERGEAMFVLKKDATAEIAALSMINEAHGGRSWTGRPAQHLADGGEVAAMPTNIKQQVNEVLQGSTFVVRVGDIATGLTDMDNVNKAGVI